MSVTLGPWGVPSDVIRKRHVRVYMVCVRVAWLHGLPIALALALALPRVAGSASFNAVTFLVIYIQYPLQRCSISSYIYTISSCLSQFMLRQGNSKANTYYEATLGQGQYELTRRPAAGATK